jgi:hypothetical protein
VTLGVLAGVWAFLLNYFRPELILLDTYPAGGDTPSFVHPVEHLRDVLLPAGLPQGWDLGNFGGYAPYQFYFLPPSLAMIAMSAVIPLNVAFKLVTVAGTFLLPLSSLLALRAMRYPFPVPALGAAASLVFLFNEGNSMWGGNVPSTLAGEFSFSLGFGLAVLFFGLVYRGVETGRGWRSQAAVLALAGLCHPVAFLNAASPGLFFLLDRARFARNLRHLVVVYGMAVLLMGFWLVPLVAKVGYSTSINWTWHFQSWREPLPRILLPFAALALIVAAAVLIRPLVDRVRARAAGAPGGALGLAAVAAAAVLALVAAATAVVATVAVARDLVPPQRLGPGWVTVLAAIVATALLAARTARAAPGDRPACYLLFGILVTTILFYNATAAGLPEIRFAPFAQLLVVLLAVDLVARPLALVPAPVLPGLVLVGLVVAWVEASITYVPSWIRWNYEGIERKPTYPTLRKLFDHLAGTITEPRVAYENSPQYERFGSMRIFESLPHFAGRATLEGLLLQTPVTAPFVYYIQSEISLQGTGVIPGYPYPSVNAPRGTPRLDLFNTRDLLAITPEVKNALAADPRWERTLDLAPYAVFRRRDADHNFVRVPRFRPVLVHTKRWKRDFHRWFSDDAALGVPIVAADTVPAAERARFTLESRSPTDLPRAPLHAVCAIVERLSPLALEFTTTCPGLPHWISMAYYPNWQVEGAARVYLASPAFMLVFPDGPRVRLAFRRLPVDWLGIAASLVGLLLWAIPPLGRRLEGELPAAVARPLARAHPWLVVGTATVVLAVTAWNVAAAIGPPRFYQRGWKAFEKQDYPTAIGHFERAILFGRESNTAADATFFRAASLLRSNRPADALAGYRTVIERFPFSIWVAESHYHVGLCLRQLGRLREAKAAFRHVMVHYPGNRWAGFAAEQMAQLRDQARARPRRG